MALAVPSEPVARSAKIALSHVSSAVTTDARSINRTRLSTSPMALRGDAVRAGYCLNGGTATNERSESCRGEPRPPLCTRSHRPWS
jgi:hypothetical protein